VSLWDSSGEAECFFGKCESAHVEESGASMSNEKCDCLFSGHGCGLPQFRLLAIIPQVFNDLIIQSSRRWCEIVLIPANAGTVRELSAMGPRNVGDEEVGHGQAGKSSRSNPEAPCTLTSSQHRPCAPPFHP
jgi:hypothetical protein